MLKVKHDGENDFCDAFQIEKMQDAISQQESKQDDDHNNVDDIDINHRNAPSVNTLLDEQQIDVNSMLLTYAPGEGKRPIFNEPLAEYLCFPSIFCGQKCPPNEERTHPLKQWDIFKYELCSVDTCVASNIPNIFWKAKHKQTKQITDKVLLAVCRNKTKGKKITARTLLDKEQCKNIVSWMKGIIFFAQLEAVLHTLILRRKMSWQWLDNFACQPSSTPYQQQIQNGQTYLYASVNSLMVQIIQKLILTECYG